MKNRFEKGDMLEIIHPSGNQMMRLDTLTNMDGVPIEAAPGSPLHVRIPLGAQHEKALIARMLAV